MIIGDIRKAKQIGKKGYHSYVWSLCLNCGKPRWVVLEKGKAVSDYCHTCGNAVKNRGEKNKNWGGGRRITEDGYITVKLSPDDFYYPMVPRDGYVREHRLIMAKSLNRCLLSWEVVHHRNGIRDDNRIENLKLMKGNADHQGFNNLQKENKQLRKRIKELEEQLYVIHN